MPNVRYIFVTAWSFLLLCLAGAYGIMALMGGKNILSSHYWVDNGTYLLSGFVIFVLAAYIYMLRREIAKTVETTIFSIPLPLLGIIYANLPLFYFNEVGGLVGMFPFFYLVGFGGLCGITSVAFLTENVSYHQSSVPATMA